RLHESLSSSVIHRINSAVQSGTAAALEQILKRRLGSQCFLVGSFADGWGNCLTGGICVSKPNVATSGMTLSLQSTL
uniref:AT-hook motif nuclear-localized protein n=1 Tax=Macrostomum lignano TaxID=282301 RepID=A0A1I8FRH5_9PLAT